MDVFGLLAACKLHTRVDHNDEDADILLMLTAAAGDVAHAAGYTLPATSTALPDDLRFAIIDQAAALYDARGQSDGRPGLTLAASRIVARYRGVRIDDPPAPGDAA
jgi:hypothetical protein